MSGQRETAYYPVFLDLSGRLCCVIGGGRVAERKIEGLLEAGARVRLVSPEISERIRALADSGLVDWLAREYRPGDLEGAFLVIGATPDRTVNARVYGEAESRGVLVNIVDDPEYCSFILAGLLRRGDFQIAVSTGGASPFLARRVRELLERLFPEHYAQVVATLADIRERVKGELDGEEGRRRFWEAFVDLDYFTGLAGKDVRAELMERADRCLSLLED